MGIVILRRGSRGSRWFELCDFRQSRVVDGEYQADVEDRRSRAEEARREEKNGGNELRDISQSLDLREAEEKTKEGRKKRRRRRRRRRELDGISKGRRKKITGDEDRKQAECVEPPTLDSRC